MVHINKGQTTILHLIATNFYGGPEKQIVEHLRRLDSRNYKCTVGSFLERGENEILVHAETVGLKTLGIPMKGPVDISTLRVLNQYVQKTQVDLLCVHGYKAAVIGWLVAVKNKIPVLAFSRGFTAECKKVAFYEWLDRQVLKRVDGIISVSGGQEKKLAAYGVKGKRNWVVHNAVVVPEYDKAGTLSVRAEICKRFTLPENSRIVVSAGRLSPEKGHRFLVEAIQQVVAKYKDVIFILCGDGPCKEELECQAKSSGVDRFCRFPGFQRNIQEIFQAMDLMVLPSLTEGLPNVVLESFALAKTVVATKVGGVPELVVDGENGYLVESQRPDLLAQAILDCLDSPETMAEMGRRGYEKVVAEFSFEGQTKKLEKIYSEVMGTN